MNNQEQVWREEFERTVSDRNKVTIPGLSLKRWIEPSFSHEYQDPEVWLAFEFYLEARKKAQVEIDEMTVDRDRIHKARYELIEENQKLQGEIDELKDEYAKISCAYCGDLCARDINELIKHVEKCEKHPVFKLIKEKLELRELVKEAIDPMDWYEDSGEWLKKAQELLKENCNE